MTGVASDPGVGAAGSPCALLYLRHALRHGLVGVTDPVDGVVAFLPPDAPEPDAGVVLLHERFGFTTLSDPTGRGDGPPAWWMRAAAETNLRR